MAKMASDFYEFTISQHFLPALIYGDHTGLTNCEELQFNDWIARAEKNLPKFALSHHWTTLVEDCSHYARCEITGYMGEVADVGLVFMFEE